MLYQGGENNNKVYPLIGSQLFADYEIMGTNPQTLLVFATFKIFLHLVDFKYM